jgi:hypothetical protein
MKPSDRIIYGYTFAALALCVVTAVVLGIAYGRGFVPPCGWPKGILSFAIGMVWVILAQFVIAWRLRALRRREALWKNKSPEQIMADLQGWIDADLDTNPATLILPVRRKRWWRR